MLNFILFFKVPADLFAHPLSFSCLLKTIFTCYLRARMCWPLLCLCRPFCIFERCLDSIPESCRSKQARYCNLATHLPINLATHLPVNLATHLPVNLATHLPANLVTHLPSQFSHPTPYWLLKTFPNEKCSTSNLYNFLPSHIFSLEKAFNSQAEFWTTLPDFNNDISSAFLLLFISKCIELFKYTGSKP